MEINKENNGPEFEVGIHLESGLDMARNELDGLSEDLRTWLTVLGKQIVSLQTNLVADEDNKLADVSRTLLEEPWIKYVSDLAFAEDAVTRASAGFDRYVELRPILTCYELSEVATKCLQEAGRMFLFSFDNGCVTFCGSALEQTLRKALKDAGHTPGEKDTIGPLIKKACECNLLSPEGEKAARNLKCTRNDVIHRPFMVEGEDLKNEALKAMDNLGKILEALGLNLQGRGITSSVDS